METGRRREHARNPKLEALLQELNGLLAGGEDQVVRRFSQPKHPVVFVMGCARSGTTLLQQYMTATGVFSYPSNLVARFYRAPYIGARIQQMLTDSDYDFGEELTAGNADMARGFSSRLGKTRGILSPSEFWYFWRLFFPSQEIQHYTPETLQTIDTRSFVAEIAALESVRGQPLLMKGLYLNWNIGFLSQLFDKAVFVHIRRNPFYNMQSLLRARRDFFAQEERWYSFKPPEYAELADCPVDEQLAGQVYYTNQAISKGLATLAPERRLVIDYELLCAQPDAVFARLAEQLATQGCDLDVPSDVPVALRPSCQREVSEKRMQALIGAYRVLSGEDLDLAV